MSVLKQVLQQSGEGCVNDFDADLANKRRWEWLETVTIDVKKSYPKITWTSNDPLVILLKDCIIKIKQLGQAICIVVNLIATSLHTVKEVLEHIMGKSHVLKVITEMQCYKLPSAASTKSDKNYGAPPAY